MISIINSPTSKTSVNFKTAVFKTDTSNHFPVWIKISSTEKLAENKYTYVFMKVITDEATKSFNQALYESDWVE